LPLKQLLRAFIGLPVILSNLYHCYTLLTGYKPSELPVQRRTIMLAYRTMLRRIQSCPTPKMQKTTRWQSKSTKCTTLYCWTVHSTATRQLIWSVAHWLA